MTNLLVGDFIDFIFSKSFVVGIGILFLPSTRADKALFHYHSTQLFYDLSFPFSHFCRPFVAIFIVKTSFVAYFIVGKFTVGCSLAVKSLKSVSVCSCVLVLADSFASVTYFYLTMTSFFTSFWPTLAVCLSWMCNYFLLLITCSLDKSVLFSQLLFRILTRILLVFTNFCCFLVILNFFYFLEVFYA